MKPVEAHQVRPDPLVGAVLDGRYRVGAIIATGGMSAVYRGLDIRLDRPVAIKVMDSRYAADQQFLTRFQREARAVARLKDPGLVAVYDQGVDGHHPFLVMELVEGGTLRELLRERGPMPPHAVAAVLRPVLGGLAVAHRSGLVHRDVKPENVLISDEGEVKIADFGLVRAVAEAKITSDSVILGTAAYLSPEQVSSGDATPRSDVYACGILAYELLTGVDTVRRRQSAGGGVRAHGQRRTRAQHVSFAVCQLNSTTWCGARRPATLLSGSPTPKRWPMSWTRSPTNSRYPSSGCPPRGTPRSMRLPRSIHTRPLNRSVTRRGR